MEKNSVERNTTLLASLGSALEYYDFVIYAMMAKYLSTLFFPALNESASQLRVWLVFALGYFARPVGGVIAGFCADKFGRKPAFLFLTLLMAVSTLCIGLLPSFAEMGMMATLLLILCRLLQGLSLGGELPGATTIVAELAIGKRRALRQSFVLASVSVGALTATFILFLLSQCLNEAEILQFGWRLPFLLGGILGIGLFFARRKLSEPEMFVAIKEKQKYREPLIVVFKSHSPAILTGILLTTFSSSLIVINLFFPLFISKYFHYSEKDVYFATTLSLIFAVIIFPMLGRIADRVSRVTFLRKVAFAFLILVPALFHMLSFQSIYILIFFMFVHQLFIAAYSVCYFPMIVDLFPTEVRFTGIAICYNITYAAMSTLPAQATGLLEKFQSFWVVPIILAVMASIAIIASLFYERIMKKSFDRLPPFKGLEASMA